MALFGAPCRPFLESFLGHFGNIFWLHFGVVLMDFWCVFFRGGIRAFRSRTAQNGVREKKRREGTRHSRKKKKNMRRAVWERFISHVFSHKFLFGIFTLADTQNFTGSASVMKEFCFSQGYLSLLVPKLFKCYFFRHSPAYYEKKKEASFFMHVCLSFFCSLLAFFHYCKSFPFLIPWLWKTDLGEEEEK